MIKTENKVHIIFYLVELVGLAVLVEPLVELLELVVGVGAGVAVVVGAGALVVLLEAEEVVLDE